MTYSVNILAHRKEERTYREYFQARCLKFFSNAYMIGQYVTGITVHYVVETTLTIQLTDDANCVKSIVSVKKSSKLKFVRQPKSGSLPTMTSSESQY